MSLPFNITNPGFVLGSQLTSQESALVTELAALSPTTGQVFQYDGANWIVATLAGTGDVTAAAVFGTDNVLIRSDGTAKGVQASGITITDANAITGATIDGGSNTITSIGTSSISDEAVTLAKLAHVATNRILGRSTAGTGDVEALADSAVRGIIGLATTDSPQFAGLEIGHATDTTITRVSSGVIAVEGVTVPTISSTNTLTNKTIDGDNNTISNLDIGNEVDWPTATDVADRTAFASGDKLLIHEAGVGLRKIDYDDLPLGGSGDVVGPASATDNAVARFDLTTGKLIQNSGWTISDTNVLSYNQGAGVLIQLTATGVSAGATLNLSGTDDVLLDGGTQGVFVSNDDLKTNGIQERTAASGVTVDGIILKDNTVSSDGSVDLVLQTGNATTGSITIADGANGNINLSPNGTGNVYIQSNLQMDDLDAIVDSNNNKILEVDGVVSAVNYLNVTNAATGTAPKIYALGTDSNVDIELRPKGTGQVVLASGDGFDVNSHSFGDSTEVDNGNSGTADTIDWGAGNFQKSTLTGNVTYTFTAPPVKGRFQLMLVQDGTGSRTATWPAAVKWPGGTAPTLSTAASSIDIVTFYYDGTNYYGQTGLNFQ